MDPLTAMLPPLDSSHACGENGGSLCRKLYLIESFLPCLVSESDCAYRHPSFCADNYADMHAYYSHAMMMGQLHSFMPPNATVGDYEQLASNESSGYSSATPCVQTVQRRPPAAVSSYTCQPYLQMPV